MLAAAKKGTGSASQLNVAADTGTPTSAKKPAAPSRWVMHSPLLVQGECLPGSTTAQATPDGCVRRHSSLYARTARAAPDTELARLCTQSLPVCLLAGSRRTSIHKHQPRNEVWHGTLCPSHKRIPLQLFELKHGLLISRDWTVCLQRILICNRRCPAWKASVNRLLPSAEQTDTDASAATRCGAFSHEACHLQRCNATPASTRSVQLNRCMSQLEHKAVTTERGVCKCYERFIWNLSCSSAGAICCTLGACTMCTNRGLVAMHLRSTARVNLCKKDICNTRVSKDLHKAHVCDAVLARAVHERAFCRRTSSHWHSKRRGERILSSARWVSVSSL
jgi:hypothetical protein